MTKGRPYTPTAAQLRMVDRISNDAHGKPGLLVPLERPGGGGALPMTYWIDVWSDEPLGKLIWMAVATRLNDIIQLDHTWSFGFHGRPHEQWGFVTEPYNGSFTASDLRAAQGALESWSIWIYAYPPADASHNPPHCTPIAVTFMKDRWHDLVRPAMRWLADL